jgi:hypothetical protein
MADLSSIIAQLRRELAAALPSTCALTIVTDTADWSAAYEPYKNAQNWRTFIGGVPREQVVAKRAGMRAVAHKLASCALMTMRTFGNDVAIQAMIVQIARRRRHDDDGDGHDYLMTMRCGPITDAQIQAHERASEEHNRLHDLAHGIE